MTPSDCLSVRLSRSFALYESYRMSELLVSRFAKQGPKCQGRDIAGKTDV